MSSPIPATPVPASKPTPRKSVKHPDKKRTRKAKVASKAKKSTAKVINGGFIQRVAKPASIGMAFKSRMVRVDGEFADWLREEAKRAGTSVTEVSRSVYQSLTD